MSNHSKTTKFIVYTGVMSAIAIVLYLFLEIPITPDGALKIDLSDLPAAMAGVILGPLGAVAVEFIKELVHLPVRGMATSMGYGDLMNFIVGVALTVPFSIVFRSLSKRNIRKYIPLIAAGITGMAAMTAAGVIGNYLIAPPFFSFMMHVKLTSALLWTFIGSATILNIIKSTVTALLMVPIIKAAKKYSSLVK